MHLVRINVKPRAQHGRSSTTDTTDPAVLALRHSHGLPTPAEKPPQFTSSVWQLLPFAKKVSTYINIINLRDSFFLYIYNLITIIISIKLTNTRKSQNANPYWD